MSAYFSEYGLVIVCIAKIYFLSLQLEACAHPFFDELREPNARLPNGRAFPPLFNFKQEVWCFRSLKVYLSTEFPYVHM